MCSSHIAVQMQHSAFCAHEERAEHPKPSLAEQMDASMPESRVLLTCRPAMMAPNRLAVMHADAEAGVCALWGHRKREDHVAAGRRPAPPWPQLRLRRFHGQPPFRLQVVGLACPSWSAPLLQWVTTPIVQRLLRLFPLSDGAWAALAVASQDLAPVLICLYPAVSWVRSFTCSSNGVFRGSAMLWTASLPTCGESRHAASL